MGVFGDYAKYYNAFYQDKDYEGESDSIVNILNRHGVINGCILNLGCGTGKHDIYLRQKGFDITGIDLSDTMIRIAKESNPAYADKYLVSDIRTYIPTMKYQAVTSLFHVISYQNSNEDVLYAFKTARKALDVGGLFLFDVWYGPGVLTERPEVRVKEVQMDEYSLIRMAHPIMHEDENIVDVNYDVIALNEKNGGVSRTKELHRMRYFFQPELREFLEICGFEMIEVLDCRTMQKTSFDSWTVYVIAKAK